MPHKKLREYAQQAVDGDKEALSLVVLYAPTGTLGDTDPVEYAQKVLDDEIELGKDDHDKDGVGAAVTYGDGPDMWRAEDDARALMTAQEIQGDPERYQKAKACLEKKAVEAKAALADL
jgi:hypothetical protein